jgi:opacity protein-like surface antigen
MKITPSILGLSIAALAISCNLAHASDTQSKPFSPLTPSGSSQKAPNYVGGSMGSSSTNNLCGTLQNCGNSDQSWKLFAGIRMNDNVLLEGGYTNLGTQQAQDSNGNVTQKVTALTAAALATYPMNDQIELFGKAGVARWTDTYTDSNDSKKNKGTNVLVGAGANYDLGDNIGVRTEWERYKGIGNATHKGDVDLLSVGLTFSSL